MGLGPSYSSCSGLENGATSGGTNWINDPYDISGMVFPPWGRIISDHI